MLTIVVPTYREAETIGDLIIRIDEVLGPRSLTYELLIVDDNSPDDICDVVEGMKARYPVRLIQPQGREKDLSLSVIDGIRAAKNDLILVMDADLSHPPETIPEMFETLCSDEQSFVIGSRYVEHGSFDRHWSLWRFLNSHIATMLTRPLVDCADPMSGFMAFNRRQIGDLDKLKPIGYKIGLELMVRGDFSRVQEVAIQFQDREVGESKMNLTQQFRFLRHLRRLYTVKFGTLAEFLNYGAVGASGFLVDLFFYYLLQAFGIHHQWARALSFWPAVTWNWRLNRSATFGERKRRPGARQWLEFVFTSLLGFSLNWGVYVTLTRQFEFFDEYRLVALIAGIAAASVLNFVLSSIYVYNDKRL